MASFGPSPIAQTTPAKFAAFEPDNQWKLNLKQRIQRSLAPRVADAQRAYARQRELLGSVDDARRAQVEHQHAQAMHEITMTAQKTFEETLRREINLRRWELDPTCLTAEEEADIRVYQAHIWQSATAQPSGSRSRSSTAEARMTEQVTSASVFCR
jgi:hypothetical protein